jgi:hypothetical protein
VYALKLALQYVGMIGKEKNKKNNDFTNSTLLFVRKMLIWSHFWLPLPDHRSNNNKRRHAAQQFRSSGSIPK